MISSPFHDFRDKKNINHIFLRYNGIKNKIGPFIDFLFVIYHE